MISFNVLGKLGRFGNQMFQYATLLSIAKTKGYEFCIPPSNVKNLSEDHQLFEAFDLPSLTVIGWQRTEKRQQPSTFAYDAALVEKCEDNSDLYGYFQTEKYFSTQAQKIRNEFSFKETIRNTCHEVIKNIGGHAISLHVRRTDYLNDDRYPPCSLDYYQQALSVVPPNLPIIVFSDDMEWCKKQPLFNGKKWFYSEGNRNIFDMCLMSMCEHHIIANSSFSWWGAWLGNNSEKIIVSPKRWFGTGFTAIPDTRDLIPANWISF
jgi:hypothetical protein